MQSRTNFFSVPLLFFDVFSRGTTVRRRHYKIFFFFVCFFYHIQLIMFLLRAETAFGFVFFFCRVAYILLLQSRYIFFRNGLPLSLLIPLFLSPSLSHHSIYIALSFFSFSLSLSLSFSVSFCPFKSGFRYFDRTTRTYPLLTPTLLTSHSASMVFLCRFAGTSARWCDEGGGREGGGGGGGGERTPDQQKKPNLPLSPGVHTRETRAGRPLRRSAMMTAATGAGPKHKRLCITAGSFAVHALNGNRRSTAFMRQKC